MTIKLNFSIEPPRLEASSPLLARSSPITTAKSNISVVAAALLALPENPLYSAYQQAETAAYKECDTLAKKIVSLQCFIRDLDNLNIDNANYLLSFKQFLGMPAYKEFCAQLAFEFTGEHDGAAGEELLNQNFRIILRLKDRDGQNPLEQILVPLIKNLEHQRAIAELNSIGALLSQTGKDEDTRLNKAKAIFQKLHQEVKGALCERIWRLDSMPKGNHNYGYDEALKDMQKLLRYKNVFLLQETIDTLTSKLSTMKFAISTSYIHKNEFLTTDSKRTTRTLLDLYQLLDLKILLDDPTKKNEFLVARFKKLNTELRNFICRLVWIAYNKPDELCFGEIYINRNVRILVDVLKDQSGTSLLLNLIAHYKQLLNGQRQLQDLNHFALNCHRKTSKQLLESFNGLSIKAREDLRYRVWFQDGGKDNPHFGGPFYGTKKIDADPFLFFFGEPPIFKDYLLELQKKIDTANATMLADFESKCTLPENAINVSSDQLLHQPDLIQKLPSTLRAAFVTAEFAGIASLGGLAPALDGMVRGMGMKSRVITPLYRNGPIAASVLDNMKEKLIYRVEHYGRTHKVFKFKIKGIRVYLIDAPELFWIPAKEDGTSGNFYNGEWAHVKRRWAVFQSLSEQLVYKFSQKKKNPVQLVHVHDAQTALIPKLLAYRHPDDWKQGKTPATVFTFHNNMDPNSYEDDASMSALNEIGLPRQRMNSFIEALSDADMVTTVSETFGKEAQTSTFGNGLDFFVKRAAFHGKVVGIVNGNSNNWDPTKDEQLQNWKSVATGTPMDLRFGPDTPNLADKIKTIQSELCAYLKAKDFNDPAFADLDPKKPIVFYVGRYDYYQKGIDKLPLIMEEALKNGAQFICVGVEPDSEAKEVLEKMKKYAEKLGKKGAFILKIEKSMESFFIKAYSEACFAPLQLSLSFLLNLSLAA